MTRLTLTAPSRLHFGLLAWGPDAPRQFGGVGLMVADPGLELVATPAGAWSASGPLASRALDVARRVAGLLETQGHAVAPLDLQVLRAPAEHVGLGLGTQLGLGVALLICRASGWLDPSLADLARLAGRGLRSGIGLHGFHHGGLIVDGGRKTTDGIPPLLARLDFPADWPALIVVPRRVPGLHGEGERRAFADLPPFPEALTDRLCRLVLLGLLPAVAERDLVAFGEALEELQRRVGEGFAPAQGGTYARPEARGILDLLRAEGLRGLAKVPGGQPFTGSPTLAPTPAGRRSWPGSATASGSDRTRSTGPSPVPRGAEVASSGPSDLS